MRLWIASLLSLAFIFPVAAVARSGDVMPPPQKAPRTPVEKQSIKVINAQPMEYEGKASAIDGERLTVGGREVRLFGILTPSLSSNYGPQAKAQLDQLVKGKDVLCKVTSRDADGGPIAFCGTVNTPDISYEMLRQGWAMTDGKALKNNSLADVYGKVEQEAKAQNKGLFAPAQMTVSVPITNPSRSIILPSPSAPIALVTAAAMPTQPVQALGAKVDGTEKPAEAAAPEVKAEATETPKIGDKAPDELIAATLQDNSQRRSGSGNGRGFFERFQQFFSAMIWLVAAAGFGGALILRDRLRLMERRRLLAAALQGELTALRQICRTRSRELSRQRRIMDAEAQPRPSQLWPRLRTAVYQAHAANIGLLGSELSRQVARIYGQCADFAIMAQGQAGAAQARQPSMQAVSESLSSLSDQIEGALEALAEVEATGQAYVAELPSDEDYGMPLPEPAAEPASEAAEAKKKMEKAADVLAGLFKNRRAKAEGEAKAAADGAKEDTVESAPAPSDKAEDGQRAA